MEQCKALGEGRVPAEVKPLKISVDVPELDQQIPAEFCMLKIELNEGSTFRSEREAAHGANRFEYGYRHQCHRASDLESEESRLL